MVIAVAPSTTSTHTELCVSRHRLLVALQRAQLLIPRRSCKPILTGVRLEAANDQLHLAATDLELMLGQTLAADGSLGACVVSCAELVRRVRASKEPGCQLVLRPRVQELVLNGGQVKHALPTMRLADFPPVPTAAAGESISCPASPLHRALSVANTAVAREPTRYAINGVLLEADSSGSRLTATDGRRLAVCELPDAQGCWSGKVLLSGRSAAVLERLSAKEREPISIHIEPHPPSDKDSLPRRLHAAGTGWLLSSYEHDGHFPAYQDYVPPSSNRFAVGRLGLEAALGELGAAAEADQACLAVSLRARSIELGVGGPDTARTSAKLPARHLGGTDKVIHTGFKLGYLLDAVRTLGGEQVVIDVGQNTSNGQQVGGRPALLHGEDDPRVRWVIMPVCMDWPSTHEYLGTNYKAEPAQAG